MRTLRAICFLIILVGISACATAGPGHPGPPPPPSLRIMAIGDSLTWGFGSTTNGGYRFPLYDRIEETGRQFQAVGRYSDGPQDFDKPWHEGHSGATIRALDQQWMPTAMQTYRPDVTLLMIGT